MPTLITACPLESSEAVWRRLRLPAGASDLDASALQAPTSRALTQKISRITYDAGFDGLYYRSRYGHDVDNWALFEPFRLDPVNAEPIRLTDPDLESALRIHSLVLK